MRLLSPRSSFVALALVAAPAPALAAPPKADPPPALRLAIQRATLVNGLRVVMNVDHASNAVALAVTYDVGSRDEAPGQGGFARLFEHLLFGATKNLAAGEFESLVASRGGFVTARSAVDRTAYSMVVPENELALGLWLEAERMHRVDLSQAAIDADEKALAVLDRVPYGKAEARLGALAFEGALAYAHGDHDRADVAAIRAFHVAHFGPNTAILGISGDFDPDMAMNLVHRYFDGIPRIQATPFVEPNVPEQAAERREVVEDALARAPALSYGFVMPKLGTREYDALRLAQVILGDGEGSRFVARLVRGDALATEARAEVDARFGRGPGLFRIEVRLAKDAAVSEVEKRVDAALKELADAPPTEAETIRARKRLEAGFVLGLAGNRQRALELGKYELWNGDARAVGRELERLASVTPADVQRAAAQYFVTKRRTVIETRPKPTVAGNLASTAEGSR
ncbi:M16 family metallopeptidase [Polyangium jinanense]|uniref:Insulinase family protein n=1 Tax=Polyangium jinanense TaxID=2829994 RepID=A0A9X4AZC3_9BACT|nr:pitrilysin family protein [Polyangium jinanense]MDC3961603.1 insulinase family protein [Polyangium jinanense]MDC3988175.1 insulinase family protein [Polyangium jinanense]